MGGVIDYRHLPPVEPVDIPKRFSMTLLDRADNCPRSAYLGVKYRHGPSSHPMDRGTLQHAVLERAMKELIVRGERSFVESGMVRVFRRVDGVLVDELVPETPESAALDVAASMAALVDEVLRERPDLVVPRREVDDVREAAYHWAISYDVNPDDVAGLERLMVLDLDCGWTVSGRLDLIALPSAELGQVDDYKSGQHIRPQDEYEGSLQPWLYAVLLCFGAPVTRGPCPRCPVEQRVIVSDCETCEGRGYVETRGEPFGGHLRGVLTREVYPHPRPRDDGLLHHREMLLSRTVIADFRADLERMAATLGGRFESWSFPARSGSWCSWCPASHECPLPPALRDYAGTINTREEAAEAWELAQHQKARTAAVEREVKNFAKAHDAEIRVGDLVWRWEPTEGRAVRRSGRGSDWDGLVAAIGEAAMFGRPFDVNEWVVPTTGSSFKKAKLSKEEMSR